MIMYSLYCGSLFDNWVGLRVAHRLKTKLNSRLLVNTPITIPPLVKFH